LQAPRELDVSVIDRQRSHRVGRKGIVDFLRRLARTKPPASCAGIAVCLVSDRRMREFNQRYRNRPGSTDVLSFSADPEPDPTGELYLGDIVISVPQAARQAAERGHSLARELKLLALHGYLHLLGYDHETDNGRMTRIERRLVTRLLPRSAPTGPS